MKSILATLVLLELALVSLLVVSAFGHLESPSLARAWFEYKEHPSPETEAAFKEKKGAMDKMTFALTSGTGLLLAVNSYALFKTIRKGTAGNRAELNSKPV